MDSLQNDDNYPIPNDIFEKAEINDQIFINENVKEEGDSKKI